MKLHSAARALMLLGIASMTCAPAAAQESNLPSYASHEEMVRGRIAAVIDRYRITVHDDRGFDDNVTLHDGTVITPTGLNLASGQAVTIYGRSEGKAFVANEIDTPYDSSDAGPGGASDYGDGYASPYAVDGPYGYGPYGAYDPSLYPYGIGIGFGFYGGGGYYGHRGYYGHGGYGHGGGYYGHGGGNYGRGGGYYGRAGGYSGRGGGYSGRSGFSGGGGYGGRAGGGAGHSSGGGTRGGGHR